MGFDVFTLTAILSTQDLTTQPSVFGTLTAATLWNGKGTRKGFIIWQPRPDFCGLVERMGHYGFGIRRLESVFKFEPPHTQDLSPKCNALDLACGPHPWVCFMFGTLSTLALSQSSQNIKLMSLPQLRWRLPSLLGCGV
eukprot:PhF_6_TR36318/c0_g1_i2/m.53125